MSVTIDLVSRSGERVVTVRDTHDLVDRALMQARSRSRVLKLVEPYDDLILEHTQLDDFLADWQVVKDLVSSDHDRRAWSEVRDFARRAQQDPDVRLRFVGD